MTDVYTPTPTYRTDYTVADDDDIPSATVLMTPVEQVADMVAFLDERTIFDGTSVVRVQPMQIMDPTAWDWTQGSVMAWGNTGTSDIAEIPISNLVDLADLVSVQVYIRGLLSCPAGGSRPEVSVIETQGSASTVGAAVEDSVTTDPAWQALHVITCPVTATSIDEAQDPPFMYYVRINASGATAFRIFHITATFETTELTPGG